MPKSLRLVLLSALMLFVELALIRWVGSNVVYLSYFSNFVLLGSFLFLASAYVALSPTGKRAESSLADELLREVELSTA